MSSGETSILPLWYDVTKEDVNAYSPSLAGRVAATSEESLDSIVDKILDVVSPSGSPLVIARDLLIDQGHQPPVVTDPYWLGLVEKSDFPHYFGDRWSFPLPNEGRSPQEWGENIAYTALQEEWIEAAERIPITILTPPDQVLEFIREFPGLSNLCVRNTKLFAKYARQLTIPGFGGEFEELFETAYKESGRSKTYALRSDNFSGHEAAYITSSYFMGGSAQVSPYEHIDHLFWLLSSASSWLPVAIRAMLIEGMKDWHAWTMSFRGDLSEDRPSTFRELLLDEKYEDGVFQWAKESEQEVLAQIAYTKKLLSLPDEPALLLELFKTNKFLEHQFEKRKEWERKQEREG